MRAGPAAVVVSLVVVALLGAAAHYRYGFSHPDHSGNALGADDAYISYRYARNLADGHGLVYNPGERVEGYSNLLFVLVCAAFVAVDPDAVHSAAVGLNCLLLAAALLVLYGHLRAIGPTGWALAGLAVAALSPLLWVWPSSGLETTAVFGVQLALFVATVRTIQQEHPRGVGPAWLLLTGVLVLLRADGFVFALICGTLFLLAGQRGRFVQSAIVILAFTAATTGFRYWYYGSLLPNTFYAKVSASPYERMTSAARQLASLSWRTGFVLYLAPLLLGWGAFARHLRQARRLNLALAPPASVAGLLLLGYWMIIGGDVYDERFLLVLIPLAVMTFVQVAHGLGARRWMPAAVAAVLAVQFSPFAFDPRFEYQAGKYDRWVDLGRFLSSAHPGTILAVDAAGKVPFFAGLETIDMLGLNDLHIGRGRALYFNVGHSKFDADYVLSRRPDLIAAWGRWDFSLQWGLSREKYEAAGYRLKYAVNTGRHPKARNVADIEDMTDLRLRRVYDDGYRYLVVKRAEPE